MDAALQPSQFENWNKSMEIVRDHMLTPEFENYPPDMQARFLQHYNALWQTVMSMPNVSEPVKTTLSLRGTVGPTVGAEILRNHGIFQATPESMQERPLDTEVYDYLGSGNKGTGEGSGNHPLQTTTMLQQVAHAQDQHDLSQAKSAHEAALSQQKVVQAHLDAAKGLHAHAQDQRRAEEQHQQALALERQRVAAQIAAQRQKASSGE
jgi:hypothetical protein